MSTGPTRREAEALLAAAGAPPRPGVTLEGFAGAMAVLVVECRVALQATDPRAFGDRFGAIDRAYRDLRGGLEDLHDGGIVIPPPPFDFFEALEGWLAERRQHAAARAGDLSRPGRLSPVYPNLIGLFVAVFEDEPTYHETSSLVSFSSAALGFCRARLAADETYRGEKLAAPSPGALRKALRKASQVEGTPGDEVEWGPPVVRREGPVWSSWRAFYEDFLGTRPAGNLVP